jgi:hypothetical protein
MACAKFRIVGFKEPRPLGLHCSCSNSLRLRNLFMRHCKTSSERNCVS